MASSFGNVQNRSPQQLGNLAVRSRAQNLFVFGPPFSPEANPFRVPSGADRLDTSAKFEANRRSVMVPNKSSSSFDQKTALRLDGFAESVAFQGLRLR